VRTSRDREEDWSSVKDDHLATALEQERADIAQLLIDCGAEYDDRTLLLSFQSGMEL
jgi:adenosyl cobinamide kinase/adenosyl cobinamide phosphate guanylyltransferase